MDRTTDGAEALAADRQPASRVALEAALRLVEDYDGEQPMTLEEMDALAACAAVARERLAAARVAVTYWTLTQDVANPTPDRRRVRDWTAALAVPAGTRLTFVPAAESTRADRIYVGKPYSGPYVHEYEPLFEALMAATREPRTPSLVERLAERHLDELDVLAHLAPSDAVLDAVAAAQGGR